MVNLNFVSCKTFVYFFSLPFTLAAVCVCVCVRAPGWSVEVCAVVTNLLIQGTDGVFLSSSFLHVCLVCFPKCVTHYGARV